LTWSVLPLVLALSGPPTAAPAGPSGESSTRSPEIELQLGARAEREGAFARALAHYRACAGGASPQLARSARGRIAWIEERAEGDFVPLATLARVRREPSALAEPAAREKLSAEVESFPPGRVRAELRLRIAEARLRRDAGSEAALVGLRAVVTDQSSGGSDRVLAERDLVTALLRSGRLDDARQEVEAHPYDPRSIGEVARRVHRRSLVRAAAGAVALLALALAAWAYGRRRQARLRVAPVAASPS